MAHGRDGGKTSARRAVAYDDLGNSLVGYPNVAAPVAPGQRLWVKEEWWPYPADSRAAETFYRADNARAGAEVRRGVGGAA